MSTLQPFVKKASITVLQPGCMDGIPIQELITFLAKHNLTLVQTPDGLAIIKARVRS